MKISVITVTYNSSESIIECIRSVNKQTYSNIEHIFVDGKSTDNTVDIIRNEAKRNINIISENDRGIYDAINKGVRHASGEIVGLLHSDDIFASDDVVSTVNAQFESESSIMGVYGNIKYFKDDRSKIKRSWIAQDVYDGYFADGEIFPHTSFFVRKEVHDRIGYYRTDFQIGADYEFILRMVKVHNYKVAYLDKTIVKMRLGGESTKNISSILTSFKEVRRAWKLNDLSPPASFYLKRYFKKILQLI